MRSRQNVVWQVVGTLALMALVAACGKDASKTDGPTPGGDKPTGKKPSGEFVPGESDKPAGDAAAKAEFKNNGEFMPRPDAIKDTFTLIQGPDYYVKDTLFEQIDGASDGYIAYGFKELAKAVYKPKDKAFEEEINIEIYSFDKKWGALGKFSEERSSCGKTDTMAANWCLRQSDLLLWKGPYLIKVQTFEEGEVAEAKILELAKMVDSKVKDAAEPPAELGKFPTEHSIKGSAGWRVRDLYGFSGLKGAFIQHYRPPGDAYKAEESTVTLFTVKLASADEAKALMKKVGETAGSLSAVKASGGLKKLDGVGEEAITYTDDDGTHTFFIKGDTIAGGRDFKDDETAKMLTGKLAESI